MKRISARAKRFAQFIREESQYRSKYGGCGFGILVTNASKKGGGGFFLEKGIVVVHPEGVLAIAIVLREQIIKIAQMKLTQAEREEAIEKTFEYLQGAEFKNALDVVIRKTIEMYEELKKECQDHIKIWKKRYAHFKVSSC